MGCTTSYSLVEVDDVLDSINRIVILFCFFELCMFLFWCFQILGYNNTQTFRYAVIGRNKSLYRMNSKKIESMQLVSSISDI